MTRLIGAGIGTAVAGPLGAALGGSLGWLFSKRIEDLLAEYFRAGSEKVSEFGVHYCYDQIRDMREDLPLEAVVRKALKSALDDVRRGLGAIQAHAYSDWFENWEWRLNEFGPVHLDSLSALMAELEREGVAGERGGTATVLDTLLRSTMERLDSEARALRARAAGGGLSITGGGFRALPDELLQLLRERLEEPLQAHFSEDVGLAEHHRAWVAVEQRFQREARGSLAEILRVSGRIEEGTGEILARQRAQDAQRARLMDAELPLNLKTELSTEGWLRFAAHNRKIPFVGRERELEALGGFLSDSRPFLWWIVTGPGGAGKTRIALELCLRAEGWRAGFLRHFRVNDTWRLSPGWLPSRPTLIVVDYVSEQVERVGALASQLAEQIGDSDPPVRLLLLERRVDDLLEKRFVGTTTSEAGAVLARRYARDLLALAEMGEDEIWVLVRECSWLPGGVQLGMPRDQFFARLTELDAKRRPLVAMILAEASARSPERTVFGTLEQELEALIERDRDHLWPESLGAASTKIGGCDADVVIAWATMVNGVGPLELGAVAFRFGRRLGLNFLADCARATATPWDESDCRVGPIEPDLIGELFALTVVGRGSAMAGPHSWLAEAAWLTNESAMAMFVARAAQNFPQHPALSRVDIIVPGLTESWWQSLRVGPPHGSPDGEKIQAAIDAAPTDEGAAGALARLTMLLHTVGVLEAGSAVGSVQLLADWLGQYPGNPELERGVGNSLLITLNHARSVGDPAMRDAALGALRRFAGKFSDSQIAQYCLAAGLVDVLRQAKAEGDLTKRDALLDELREMAVVHPTDRGVCAQLAGAVSMAMVDAREEGDWARRKALLKELRDLAALVPSNEAVREELATSLFNSIVMANEEGAPEWRDALLDELRKLAARYPNDGVVGSRLAMGLNNTSAYRGMAGDAVASDALLEELRGLNRLYPADADVRTQLAEGLFNRLITANENSDGRTSDALLEELRQLERSNPQDKRVAGTVAKALSNASAYAKRQERFNRRDELLEELRQFAGQHSDDPAVRQWLATCLFNTLNHAQEELALARRDRLLEDLRQLAACYPGEAPVRERLADGLLHALTNAQAANDREGAEAMLNELRQFASAHVEDGAVRRLWAMGLRQRLIYEAQLGLAQCESRLEELRRLAGQHPADPAVREQLAKGLLAIFQRANAQEGTMSRAPLLEEIRALAQEEPDHLKVQQVLAVGLGTFLARAEIRQRPHAALDEIRGLTKLFPNDELLREGLAGALFSGVVGASEAEQTGRRDVLLSELSQLAEQHTQEAGIRRVLSRALANMAAYALKKNDTAQYDAPLDRLRQLARRHPGDLEIQQMFGQARTLVLRRVDDRGQAEAVVCELRDLAERYPTDKALRKALAAGLFGAMAGVMKREGSGQALDLIGELGRVASEHPDDVAVREVFAIALSDLTLLSHVDGALVQRDELLGKLKQLSRQHPDDRTVRGWLDRTTGSLGLSAAAE